MWTETISIFDFIYKNGYYRIEGNKQRGTVERKSEESMRKKIAEWWRKRHQETRSEEKERKEGERRWREGGNSINVRKYERGELQARQVYKIRSWSLSSIPISDEICVSIFNSPVNANLIANLITPPRNLLTKYYSVNSTN